MQNQKVFALQNFVLLSALVNDSHGARLSLLHSHGERVATKASHKEGWTKLREEKKLAANSAENSEHAAAGQGANTLQRAGQIDQSDTVEASEFTILEEQGGVWWSLQKQWNGPTFMSTLQTCLEDADSCLREYIGHGTAYVFTIVDRPKLKALVFKIFGASNTDVKQRYQKTVEAQEYCKKKKLTSLVVPNAAYLHYLGSDEEEYKLIIEERMNVATTAEKLAREWSECVSEDSPQFKIAFQQLEYFSLKKRLWDVDAENTPMVSGSGCGRIALVDVADMGHKNIDKPFCRYHLNMLLENSRKLAKELAEPPPDPASPSQRSESNKEEESFPRPYFTRKISIPRPVLTRKISMGFSERQAESRKEEEVFPRPYFTRKPHRRHARRARTKKTPIPRPVFTRKILVDASTSRNK